MTNIELIQMIDLKFEAMNLKVDAVDNRIKSTYNMIDYKFEELKEVNSTQHQEIIEHQKITNGRVNHLEEKNGHIEKKIGLLEWVTKHFKLVIIGGVVIWFVLYIVASAGTPGFLGNLIKGIGSFFNLVK